MPSMKQNWKKDKKKEKKKLFSSENEEMINIKKWKIKSMKKKTKKGENKEEKKKKKGLKGVPPSPEMGPKNDFLHRNCQERS